MNKYLAEFLGTFWLVFGGCGSAVLAAAYPELGIGFAGAGEHHGADSVIVGRNRVVDNVGIAVGIGDGHNGDAQTMGLGDGVALLAGIHDEQSAGQLLHVLHAAEQIGDEVVPYEGVSLLGGHAATLAHEG